MLDQLVESKSNSRENTRRSGFLLTTFVLITTIMLSAWLYSLFAKDYGLGSGDLELSELVAPVPVPEEEPPPPEEKKPEPDKVIQKVQNADVRKEIIQSMDEAPIKTPDKISNIKSDTPVRRKDVPTLTGDRNSNAENPAPVNSRNLSGEGENTGSALGSKNSSSPTGEVPKPANTPPPVIVKKEEPTPKPVPKTISGGVVNGKATNLVKPPYPAAARAVRAAGAVNVQVKIDERGNVVSASAVSGHPLLRQVAESAARSSKFAPTQLSGQPVSVTGVIVYNFTP